MVIVDVKWQLLLWQHKKYFKKGISAVDKIFSPLIITKIHISIIEKHSYYKSSLTFQLI
jgi:hypothetical protein